MSYRRSFDMGALEAPSNGNWVLVGRKKCVAGTPPTGSFDISGCDRFRVELDQITGAAGNIMLYFGSDNGTNYNRELLYGFGATVATQYNTGLNGMYLTGNAAMMHNLEFSKPTKIGKTFSALNVSGLYVRLTALQYTGSDVMDTLSISAESNSFTGTISVYKWAENAVPAELVTYELVKEYNLTNQILDDTIAWDGEADDICHFISNFGPIGTQAVVSACPNGDVGANYAQQLVYASGTVASGQSTTVNGMYLGGGGLSMFAKGDIALKMGKGRRKSNMIYGYYSPSQVGAVCTNSWSNTASAVTSLKIHSGGVAVTGSLYLYRLARTALITTNPNLCTLWSKSVDNDTIEVQPGEVEINGAILRNSKPKQVTLSGNLEAGIAEAANTVFYLYAVRTIGNAQPSFMFSTVAPLMDRYGNMVASFEDYDADKAWFHPTLGPNYRWVGQVLNKSDSNILAFDKCKPGLWESPWNAMPTYGVWGNIGHGFGRKPVNLDVMFKRYSGDTSFTGFMGVYYNGTTSYGAFLGNNSSTGAPARTDRSVSVYLMPNGAFIDNNTPYNWVTSGGFYKLTIKDS